LASDRYDAEIVPATTGPKPKIPNALIGTSRVIISKVLTEFMNPFPRRGFG